MPPRIVRVTNLTPACERNPAPTLRSFRGIHVDPNAPFTNQELFQLKDDLLSGNFTWGDNGDEPGPNGTGTDTDDTSTDADGAGGGHREAAMNKKYAAAAAAGLCTLESS
jgi:hypothetical protein